MKRRAIIVETLLHVYSLLQVVLKQRNLPVARGSEEGHHVTQSQLQAQVVEPAGQARTPRLDRPGH